MHVFRIFVFALVQCIWACFTWKGALEICSLYMYIYIHTHTYIYIGRQTHTHTHTHTHTEAQQTHTHIHTHTDLSLSLSISICLPASVSVCLCLSLSVSVCLSISVSVSLTHGSILCDVGSNKTIPSYATICTKSDGNLIVCWCHRRWRVGPTVPETFKAHTDTCMHARTRTHAQAHVKVLFKHKLKISNFFEFVQALILPAICSVFQQ